MSDKSLEQELAKIKNKTYIWEIRTSVINSNMEVAATSPNIAMAGSAPTLMAPDNESIKIQKRKVPVIVDYMMGIILAEIHKDDNEMYGAHIIGNISDPTSGYCFHGRFISLNHAIKYIESKLQKMEDEEIT